MMYLKWIRARYLTLLQGQAWSVSQPVRLRPSLYSSIIIKPVLNKLRARALSPSS